MDPRVAVRRSSIEGRGLVATAEIAAGEAVLRLGGRIVGRAELDALIGQAGSDPAGSYVDSITVDEDEHLVLPAGTAVHFGNHSCDPTLWIGGPYEVVARVPLQAGDELTIDYATVSGAADFAMPCRCGSPVCRGEITSDDWRRADLRARYRGHWVPALQRRIDALSSG